WEIAGGPGYPAAARRGGREAEGAGLVNLCTGNCTEGSNPSLSANALVRRNGEMAERLKAHAWKARVRKRDRGFESASLRQLVRLCTVPDEEPSRRLRSRPTSAPLAFAL